VIAVYEKVTGKKTRGPILKEVQPL